MTQPLAGTGRGDSCTCSSTSKGIRVLTGPRERVQPLCPWAAEGGTSATALGSRAAFSRTCPGSHTLGIRGEEGCAKPHGDSDVGGEGRPVGRSSWGDCRKRGSRRARASESSGCKAPELSHGKWGSWAPPHPALGAEPAGGRKTLHLTGRFLPSR